MSSLRGSAKISWLLLGGLLLLLAVLGGLQARWLSEVSDAEGHRMRAAMESAGQRFAVHFDQDLTRIFLHFASPLQVESGGLSIDVSRRLSQWRERAVEPDPVLDAWLLPLPFDRQTSLRRVDELGGGLSVEEAPLELRETLQPWLSAGPSLRGRRGRSRRSSSPLLLPELPGFVVPLFGEPPTGEPLELDRLRSHWTGLLVVRLDRPALSRGVLPELAADELSLSGEPYHYALFADGEEAPFLSRPEGWAVGDGGGDLELRLFNLLAPEELRHLSFGAPFGPGGAGVHRFMEPLLRGQRMSGAGRRERGQRGGWRLILRHPEGPLEAVLVRQRRRSYAVGFGVLLLLAGSAILVWSTTRRAQRLARQQMEAVAALTHELRTPLAGVSALGQNLADGIVAEPAQVRRYGAMIQKEGARLTHLVEQALELSGILSGQSLRDFGPVDLSGIVEEALEAVAPLAAERSVDIETHLDDPLPRLRGEPRALARALDNLLQNAVQHAGSGGWVGLEVKAGGAGSDAGEVLVEVRDRGPGIPSEELDRLFEPFFRGQRAAADKVPGSGLGLALVRQIAEAHGGSAEAHSPADGGALFRLRLPVAERR